MIVRHIMVLGNPESVITKLLGMTRKIQGATVCILNRTAN